MYFKFRVLHVFFVGGRIFPVGGGRGVVENKVCGHTSYHLRGGVKFTLYMVGILIQIEHHSQIFTDLVQI